MNLVESIAPVFENGSWVFSRPVFLSVPKPNRRVTVFSWPSGYLLDASTLKMETLRNVLNLETPPDCSLDWFERTVRGEMGYNVQGWVYS